MGRRVGVAETMKRFIECKRRGGPGVQGTSVWLEIDAIVAVEGAGPQAIVYTSGARAFGIDESADAFLNRLEEACQPRTIEAQFREEYEK